uniref:Uncharacterized protein n=1 Tax=Nelumbo nucifera TaxID=4432 RepID=A0A822Y1J2_NELNU|nr:TPA_asm: hypothetical protein HUJ06_029231 [Nelumbo nucifera]
MHEGRAIVRVGDRGWAGVLEELRVAGRFARLRTVVMVPAAQFVGSKRLTPALARHHRPVTRGTPQLQALGTSFKQISLATHHWTNALAFVRGHRHRQVKPIHQADTVGRLIVVAMVEAKLRQGSGSDPTGAITLEAATAVSRSTGEAAVGVGTTGPSPQATGPMVSRSGEGPVG